MIHLLVPQAVFVDMGSAFQSVGFVLLTVIANFILAPSVTLAFVLQEYTKDAQLA